MAMDLSDSEKSCHCKWHNDIQKCINEVENLVKNHQQQELNDDQLNKNEELVKKFVWFKGKKGKIWKQIEKFCCKPSVFQMKDIQIHIEDEIRRKDPDISDDDMKEKVNNLSNIIEKQIREDFTQKYSELSEKEINKKVREVNVRGYLTGDREKYVSDKAEFLVEDAICKIMFDKTGLLRRGLKTVKVTYQFLKNILGDITPNCSDR